MFDIRNLPDSFVIELNSHRLEYVKAGSTLIVTFDNAGTHTKFPYDRRAWGYKFFCEEGHSILGVISNSSDWYRSDVLHEKLLKLRDDGFFLAFENVIFTGSSMGGFAATAFCSLSPGCRVLSFNPQSTLKQDLVPWETNYKNGRVRDWTLRFSDGAAETSKAKEVLIFFDPFVINDRRHAARYTGENVRLIVASFLGHSLPESFHEMYVLKDIMRLGIAGKLDDNIFHHLMKKRRLSIKYWRGLLDVCIARGHFKIAEKVANHAYNVFKVNYFILRLAIVLAAQGRQNEALTKLAAMEQASRRKKRQQTVDAQATE